ncbi:MAG: sulfatase-like hydrolase/transferase [Phycisphaerales bacterium]
MMVLRAYTIIMFAALLCNLGVKLFHAVRSGLLPEYPTWILTDLAILLTLEVILALLCYRRPTIRVLRAAMIASAIVCTWSVMNAAWLIRTGTQILPMELVPLFRDPLNVAKMVFRNLLAMPGASAALFIPSAVALAFLFSVLARPTPPDYNPRRFRIRIAASLIVSVLVVLANGAVSTLGSAQITAAGMRYNCQARAVLAFLLPRYRHLARDDFRYATRRLPSADSTPIAFEPHHVNHNVVIVVLEGVQYDCTSLAWQQGGIAPQHGSTADGPTPYLATLAAQGVFFSNARSVVTHTTKALFALLTGRFPSASQDISETVPVDKPYASLATILERGLGFRTAFFQSATGTFESRPGLVYNLGFDKFFPREDLHDPNQFVGYLGADEFAMLAPITEWIASENTPFFVTILCSVTHDPYEVPAWFDAKADSQEARYLQTVTYTDRFLAALDAQLSELGVAEKTIFCVVGDHGEAFSEHRMMGHERIAYDEVLRIAMCIRAPFLIEPGRRVTSAVSSVDFTPTILGLLGFETSPMNFDGCDALAPLVPDRKVFLSGWMQQGPAGFVQGDMKFVYDPENSTVKVFSLNVDPLELNGVELPAPEAETLSKQITDWRRNTIFSIDEDARGEKIVFNSWQTKWAGRRSKVKYTGDE